MSEFQFTLRQDVGITNRKEKKLKNKFLVMLHLSQISMEFETASKKFF